MSKRNRATDVFKSIKMGSADECWPWTGAVSSKDRPYFSFDGRKQLAYRVVFRLVKGEDALTDDQLILHQCDNPRCCNPNHMKAGSHQDNMLEMKERERHGLPHHTIRAIRKLAAAGVAHSIIATQYGIGRSTVTEIVNRINYDHVKDEEDAQNA